MCGIAGYKCFGKVRPEKEEITRLFSSITARGRDAAGFAYIGSKGLVVEKAPVPAQEFVKQDEWTSLGALPDVMILHARASTQGAPAIKGNNHPVYDNGMAVVHNGIINNDDELFKKHKFKRDAQVDTEIILRLMEYGWWDHIERLNDLRGSFACAFLWEKKPEELILVRYTNPLSIHMDKDRDILFWASTEENLAYALSVWHRGFKAGKIASFSLQDDTALLVNAAGVAEIADVKARSSYSSYPNTCSSYDDWKKRDDAYNKSRGKKGHGGKNHFFQGKNSSTGKMNTTSGINRNSKEPPPGLSSNCSYFHKACEVCKEWGRVFPVNPGDPDSPFSPKWACYTCLKDAADSDMVKCPSCQKLLSGLDLSFPTCPHCKASYTLEELVLL
jgi:hypothetical protein